MTDARHRPSRSLALAWRAVATGPITGHMLGTTDVMGKGPRLLSCYSNTSSDPFKWARGLDTDYDLVSCLWSFIRRFCHTMLVGIKTRLETRLPQSRAGEQGLYLKSFHRLSRSSEAKHLPCFPSLHFTITQSRATGTADYILRPMNRPEL